MISIGRCADTQKIKALWTENSARAHTNTWWEWALASVNFGVCLVFMWPLVVRSTFFRWIPKTIHVYCERWCVAFKDIPNFINTPNLGELCCRLSRNEIYLNFRQNKSLSFTVFWFLINIYIEIPLIILASDGESSCLRSQFGCRHSSDSGRRQRQQSRRICEFRNLLDKIQEWM